MSSSNSSPPAPESINATALAALRELDEGGPPVIFRELVELFHESTPQLLSQACAAVEDPLQLAMIAHTLKGSCSNFGAHRMEALCLELEQLGRERKTENARAVIDAIEQEYLNVRVALAEACASA